MREAATGVTARTRNEMEQTCVTAKGEVSSLQGGEGLEVAYQQLSSRRHKTIDVMDGMNAFAPLDKPLFDMTGFKSAYEWLLRANPVGLLRQSARQIAD